MKSSRSLLHCHPIQTSLINLALLATLGVLIVGIFAPMLTLKYVVLGIFVWNEKTVSLYTTITELYAAKETLLFLIISTFSVVFPIMKIVVLLLAANLPLPKGSWVSIGVKWVEHLGKWSMLEVFVVALLLVSVKLGALLNVQVHYGVYLFALAVVMTMILSWWVSRLHEVLASRELDRTDESYACHNSDI